LAATTRLPAAETTSASGTLESIIAHLLLEQFEVLTFQVGVDVLAEEERGLLSPARDRIQRQNNALYNPAVIGAPLRGHEFKRSQRKREAFQP